MPKEIPNPAYSGKIAYIKAEAQAGKAIAKQYGKSQQTTEIVKTVFRSKITLFLVTVGVALALLLTVFKDTFRDILTSSDDGTNDIDDCFTCKCLKS